MKRNPKKIKTNKTTLMTTINFSLQTFPIHSRYCSDTQTHHRRRRSMWELFYTQLNTINFLINYFQFFDYLCLFGAGAARFISIFTSISFFLPSYLIIERKRNNRREKCSEETRNSNENEMMDKFKIPVAEPTLELKHNRLFSRFSDLFS